MQEIKAENGGRPFVNDDLLLLQRELTAAVQAQFLGRGAFILSGCRVSGPATGATITPGIVCLDGQLLRYYGQSNAQLPAQLQASPYVLSDPRTYQTGGTKNCQQERPAVLVTSNPAYTGGEFLPLDTWGGKRWEDVQRAQQWELGDVKPTANLVTANYDATGLGKPGTPAWGWGLCNGQGGRADLSEKFIVGANPANPTYALGATGGEAEVTLDISQLPNHRHGLGLRYGQSNSGQSGNIVRTDSRNDGALGATEATGGGQAHNNLPPFYALAMRQWVGY
jgi:hypothetical protein